MGQATPILAACLAGRPNLNGLAVRSPWDRDARLTPREIAGRAGLIGLIALAHLILLLIVLAARNEHRAEDISALKLIAIADADQPAAEAGPEAPPAPPPPSPEPVEPIEPIAELLLPTALPIPAALPFAPDLSSLHTGGGGCALPIVIGRAIEADPAAMAFLNALPLRLRTEADAVMLWNGVWMQTAMAPGQDAMTPLRQIVIRIIQAAPSVCVESQTIGPRFIPLANGNRTMMLAVGSGLWRWADLIVDEPFPGHGIPAAPSRPGPDSGKPS